MKKRLNQNQKYLISILTSVVLVGILMFSTGFNMTGRAVNSEWCSDSRTSPYHLSVENGRCVWSCGVGTIPDKDSNSPTYGECICKKGFVELEIDFLGRRICDFSCTPKCEGVECGNDGCGGSCSNCVSGKMCSNGKCVCAPNCNSENKQCGDDGCGGTCGTCTSGFICAENGKCTV